jgi:hypothetical protein
MEINKKQQEIKVRQIKESGAMTASAQPAKSVDQLTNRVSQVRLMVNDLLTQSDIELMNAKLAGKSAQEQAEVLEQWMNWIERKEKFEKVYNSPLGGYFSVYFTVSVLKYQMDSARLALV